MLRAKRTILGSDIELELKRFYFAAEYLQDELETFDLPNVNEFISGYYLQEDSEGDNLYGASFILQVQF